jgi:methylthioribose-1-phosphate isomerase
MKVGNDYYTGIWLNQKDPHIVQIIDQRKLPHQFEIIELKTFKDALHAINDMALRGAPLIGSAAGYAIYLASLEACNNKNFDHYLLDKAEKLKNSRPTAVDLFKAVDMQMDAILKGKCDAEKVGIALKTANKITKDIIEICKNIGLHGLKLIEDISKCKNGETVNILTHCNAGWLATVDYGTATAPVYLAQEMGIKVHVWVDETRPRNQGASLTAWEMLNQGVPHTVIADNTGGHLMQHGLVDMVIVGTDRTTLNGDVANKIGTYLKALAAKDNNIPFYVAAPSTSIDFTIRDGVKEIPIELRDPDEVKYIQGWLNGKIQKVLLSPEKSPAANYGFDVTPARLVTALITERGICKADKKGILKLFPEYDK